MNKFNHNFTLFEKNPSYRIYKSDDNIARIDFISESCMRVAIYKENSKMLPTFSVSPDNNLLINGRNRLSLDGFSLCKIESKKTEIGERFTLPCGVEINLDLHNFILSYFLDGKKLFSDRKPLPYNFDGEFGKDSYHYITREKTEKIYGLGDKSGDLNKSGRAFRVECSDAMGYDAKKATHFTNMCLFIYVKIVWGLTESFMTLPTLLMLILVKR